MRPALRKPRGRSLLAAALLLAPAVAAPAQEWYVSDASGIALKRTTATVALALDFALSIDSAAEGAPATVRAAVPVGGSLELRALYEKGAEVRRRWAALDAAGFERYVESRRPDGKVSYERYDASRRFIEEGRQAGEGARTIIRYAYSGDRLVRAEAFEVSGEAFAVSGDEAEKALWVDAYRYLRSGALRSVERTYPALTEGGKAARESARFEAPRGVPRLLDLRSADGSSVKTAYDASGRVVSRETFDAEGKPIGAAEVATYATEGEGPRSVVRSEEAGVTVETGLDERGRAVHELRTDAEGNALTETRTVWQDNRIASIETVAGGRTRRTEYEYDEEGNRTMERNYLDGKLERTVRRSGGEETEELYSDGVPVLRAVWLDGRKVSERRLRKSGGNGK